MKKMLLAALGTVLGLINVSSAGIVDYVSLKEYNNPLSGSAYIGTSANVDGSADLQGVVFADGYVIVGEAVIGLASDLTLYITNTDNNDDFVFTVVGLDAAKDVIGYSATSTLSVGNMQALVLPAGAYSYVGVKVEVAANGDTDVFNANVSYVPEPVTMSTLALGGLALLRKNRR